MPGKPESSSQPPSEEKIPKESSGARIVSMSLTNGDTICDDYIDVEYEKETTSEAVVTLSCDAASCGPTVDPPSVTVPDMLPNGVATFHLTHKPGAKCLGAHVTAKIVQNAVPNSMTRTVNVDCGQP